jgi:PAS domain S-box-containing protein
MLTTIADLLNNITFLLMLTMFYNFLITYLRDLPPRRKQWVQGVIFGIMAVLSTLSAGHVLSGYLLDGRNIIIAISGIVGGPISALITTSMAIICRGLIGGGGVPGAAVAAITAAMTGLLFRSYFGSESRQWLPLLLLGLFIALQRLVFTYLLGGAMAVEVTERVAIPTLLLYPFGILIIASLIRWKENNYEMQQRLKESEAYFREMSEATFEGIAITEYGVMIEANSNFAQMSGYSLSELIGMRVEQMVPEHLYAYVQAKMQEGFDKPYDSMLLRKDGTTIPIEVQSKSITYKGRLCRVNTIRDLSERIQVQETLARERDMLRTLIDQLPDYIFVKDAEGRFVVSNNAHTKATQTVSVIGKNAFEVFPPELAAQYYADDRKVMESGQGIFNVERTTVDSTGLPRTVLTTKVPWQDFSGSVLGLIGISRDITERKNLEKEQIRYSIERERVTALQKFIRDISHDLRTPLTVINTTMYIIGRSVPEEQQHRVNSVTAQVKHLTDLLDKMSEMARLERETPSDFHFKEADINTLVERVSSHQQAQAETKDQRLIFQPQPLLPPVVVDEVSLKVSIESIVKNALRYTPEGGEVVISTGVEGDQVVISVRDNGIGIAQKDLSHIFEHFYKADQARGMDSGSAGLGLSIAKKIVEHHNGKIVVESTPGEGSTFKILLPVSVEAPQIA